MLLPKKSIAIIVGFLLLNGGEGLESTRSYHLGFTPFPHDISQAAIDYVYAAIGSPQWAIFWRDTGFYDENGVSRPALDTWQDALDKDHVATRGN